MGSPLSLPFSRVTSSCSLPSAGRCCTPQTIFVLWAVHTNTSTGGWCNPSFLTVHGKNLSAPFSQIIMREKSIYDWNHGRVMPQDWIKCSLNTAAAPWARVSPQQNTHFPHPSLAQGLSQPKTLELDFLRCLKPHVQAHRAACSRQLKPFVNWNSN